LPLWVASALLVGRRVVVGRGRELWVACKLLVGDDQLGLLHLVTELNPEGCLGMVDNVRLGGASGRQLLYGVQFRSRVVARGGLVGHLSWAGVDLLTDDCPH